MPLSKQTKWKLIFLFELFLFFSFGVSPRGVVVYVQCYNIVESDFELQSRNWVYWKKYKLSCYPAKNGSEWIFLSKSGTVKIELL